MHEDEAAGDCSCDVGIPGQKAQRQWPTKSYEVLNAHVDSTIWNRFDYRDGDIVIASWGKSGCTWLQQIVGQLVFQAHEDAVISDISPWVEFAYPRQEDTLTLLAAQTHRRFVKTHLPVDALVFSPRAKYIYLAREGRDVAWSLFNHFRQLSPDWYSFMRKTRGRFGRVPTSPPTEFREFFHQWLDEDGYPFWPFWPHVFSWWALRDLPNVMLLHFTELKSDLARAITQIAAFIEAPVRDDFWSSLLVRCDFAYMKQHAARFIPAGGTVFRGGAKAFFNRGDIQGWQGKLQSTDIERYLDAEARFLPADCARWLEKGELPRFNGHSCSSQRG